MNVYLDLDVEELIKMHAARHGLDSYQCDAIFTEIKTLSIESGADETALCLIFLDSISGDNIPSGDDIVHQLKVAINNSGLVNCLPM